MIHNIKVLTHTMVSLTFYLIFYLFNLLFNFNFMYLCYLILCTLPGCKSVPYECSVVGGQEKVSDPLELK